LFSSGVVLATAIMLPAASSAVIAKPSTRRTASAPGLVGLMVYLVRPIVVLVSRWWVT
jgi:hypothetical protein